MLVVLESAEGVSVEVGDCFEGGDVPEEVTVFVVSAVAGGVVLDVEGGDVQSPPLLAAHALDVVEAEVDVEDTVEVAVVEEMETVVEVAVWDVVEANVEVVAATYVVGSVEDVVEAIAEAVDKSVVEIVAESVVGAGAGAWVVTVLKVVPGVTVNPNPGGAVFSVVCEQRGRGSASGKHGGVSAEIDAVRWWRRMMRRNVMERQRISDVGWVEKCLTGLSEQLGCWSDREVGV
jgi:hypothetical protein